MLKREPKDGKFEPVPPTGSVSLKYSLLSPSHMIHIYTLQTVPLTFQGCGTVEVWMEAFVVWRVGKSLALMSDRPGQ